MLTFNRYRQITRAAQHTYQTSANNALKLTHENELRAVLNGVDEERASLFQEVQQANEIAEIGYEIKKAHPDLPDETIFNYAIQQLTQPWQAELDAQYTELVEGDHEWSFIRAFEREDYF